MVIFKILNCSSPRWSNNKSRQFSLEFTLPRRIGGEEVTIGFYNLINCTISKATMLIILIMGFKAGPEVSFKGSPTVSPTTAAL